MNNFETCHQFLCDFLKGAMQDFQTKKVKVSRKWMYHFTYISSEKREISFLPPEISEIAQQGIYTNICFSASYLHSFLREEALFEIPTEIEENTLFLEPLKTACFFRQCARSQCAPWKEKDRLAILWRCFVMQSQKEAGSEDEADQKAVHFFCDTVGKMKQNHSYEKNEEKAVMIYIANRLFECYQRID